METQNVTLSLRKDILLKVKLMAAHQQTSISGLLTQVLESLVEHEEAYVQARRRHLDWLNQGADLGTGGEVSTERDELHERA